MKLVVFSQDPANCPGCKQYKPILDYLILKEYDVEVLDVVDNIDYANEMNVRSTPTTIVFDEGVETHRMIGARPLVILKEILDK